MSEGIAITISGPDRSGKTTMAALIAALLKHHGTDVRYDSSEHHSIRRAFELAQQTLEQEGLSTLRPFTGGVTIKEKPNA